MREPAVVRSPAVQMMSFTPIGTPPSGPGSSPAATRRSTARAVASAPVSSSVRNAPTRPSTAAMRANASRASSVAETSRRRTRAAASRGRVGEERLRGGRVRRHVVAEGGAVLLDLRGGLDRARVEGAEPRERLEDVIQVRGQALLVGGVEEEARERRDPPHLLARDGHRALVAYRPRPRNDDCLARARDG